MLSVVIPALNEGTTVKESVLSASNVLKNAGIEHEIILVDDGSTDDTGRIAKECGARVICHPRRGGYGRSLKDGILASSYSLIAITDADGTYPSDRLPDLYDAVAKEGFDMAVGARTGKEYCGRGLKISARMFFSWLCEYAVGEKIDDINSGLRVFKKELALKYMDTTSKGFSFTTTITLAAFLNGHFIKYIPISYRKRTGNSHVKYLRDSLRAFQIIVESILYYNPLKLFLLFVCFLDMAAVVSFAVYLFSAEPKIYAFFGNLAIFSFVSSIIVAVIGLTADLLRIKLPK